MCVFLQSADSLPPSRALWLFLCCDTFRLTSVLWLNVVKLLWTGQNAGRVLCLYLTVTNEGRSTSAPESVLQLCVVVKSTWVRTISCTRNSWLLLNNRSLEIFERLCMLTRRGRWRVCTSHVCCWQQLLFLFSIEQMVPSNRKSVRTLMIKCR